MNENKQKIKTVRSKFETIKKTPKSGSKKGHLECYSVSEPRNIICTTRKKIPVTVRNTKV